MFHQFKLWVLQSLAYCATKLRYADLISVLYIFSVHERHTVYEYLYVLQISHESYLHEIHNPLTSLTHLDSSSGCKRKRATPNSMG